METDDLELVVARTRHERYRHLADRPEYAAEIARMAQAIRAGLDPFTGNVPVPSAPVSPPTLRGACAHLGPPILWGDGQQALRECATCQGSVKLKLFVCEHPRHSADPTTTHMDCARCRDWEERKAAEDVEEIVTAGGDAVVNYWRGGGD